MSLDNYQILKVHHDGTPTGQAEQSAFIELLDAGWVILSSSVMSSNLVVYILQFKQ